MDIYDIVSKGGPVVWVLGGYSFIATAIVIERLVRFALLPRPPRGFETQLGEALREGRAGALLAPLRGPEVVLVRAVVAAAQENVHALGRVASRIGSQQLQAMERGFRTLEVLGNTAPLLGLFGTITGMIKAFMVIQQAGGRVDAQALAGGIWEAMITTGVGLAVSIPTLLLLHFLEGMADRRAQAMRRCASVALELLPHSPEAEEAAQGAVHHREGLADAV